MVHGKYFTSKDDIGPIIALRIAVFCEEQGYSTETERDSFDDMAYYALVYDEMERPAATGRLFIDSLDRFHIGRMCVRADCRGKGYGDLTIRMLLDLALRMNAPYIVLEAQLHAVGFYRKYGFRECGEIFLEEDRPHRPMRVDAVDLSILSGCGGHCAQTEQE